MKVIDTHCDVLYKLQKAKRERNILLDFKNSEELDINLERLVQGEVYVQLFAIFIQPSVSSDVVWEYALEQIELFHSEVIGKNPQMKHIKNWDEIDQLKPGEIGAVLTLEGAEAFGNDLEKLQHLYNEGILSIGLTWNPANLVADGVGEPRGAGLSNLGREVVRLNNENNVLTDVSHLSMQGVSDVLELAKYPFASHSNARAIFDHPRNLTDDQIKQMIAKDGHIHVVLYPRFIKTEIDDTDIADLITHIDHICSLGGEKHVGFGSDFDGIDKFIKDLEHAGKYQNLINELLKRYPEETVRGFAYENFLRFLPKN